MREPNATNLFIGQVPKDWSESDLRTVFEPFGDIHSLNVLHDKITGQHKGCAFLTYFENESAKSAQDEMHEKKTLPGASRPMIVKPAVSETKAENMKLFLGMLSRNLDETDLTNMFSPFGTIEDLKILKNADGKSKGCAFIKYETRLQAQNAIKSMHNSETMEGCNSPIVVKLADTEKDKMTKKRMQMGGAQNIHPVGGQFQTPGLAPGFINPLQQQTYYQQLLAQMALPQNVNNPGTMGALVAAMATQQQQQLQQQQQQPSDQQQSPYGSQAPQAGTLPSMYNPLAASQIKAAQPSNITALGGYGGVGATGLPGATIPSMLQQAYSGIQQYVSSFPQAYGTAQQRQQPIVGMQQQQETKKEGPDGANLFVYHIPSEFNDADLQQTFAPFGNILSAKVFIDKATGLSKCFGFVSYENPASATAAINSMNGFAIGSKRLKVQLKRTKEQSKPY